MKPGVVADRAAVLTSKPDRPGCAAGSRRRAGGVRTFHWLAVVLVLLAYTLSKGDRYSLYSAEADGLRRCHETAGTLLLAVVMLRLPWAWRTGMVTHPQAVKSMPRWLAASATVVKVALYMLLVIIPMTAVLGTWLEGIPITLIGLDIHPWMRAARGMGQLAMATHSFLVQFLLWIAGAHATAALFHYFHMHDEVLQSMLPGKGRRE